MAWMTARVACASCDEKSSAENSPALRRWETRAQRERVPSGTKERPALLSSLERDSARLCCDVYPALKRRAIFISAAHNARVDRKAHRETRRGELENRREQRPRESHGGQPLPRQLHRSQRRRVRALRQ